MGRTTRGGQTAVFRHRVRDVMGPSPLVVESQATVADLVAAMQQAGASAAVVTENGSTVGIVTEQDVLRRIAFRAAADMPVRAVMSTPLDAIRDDDPLYHAIARMWRAGRRHLPVLDSDDCPVGMLHLHEALAAATRRLHDQIDRLTGEASLDGLAAVRAAQFEVAGEMLADDIPATEIQQLLSHVNNDIYGRVTRLCLAEMAAAGEGAPPVPFAVLVLGSGGRGESFLFPDQDNGLILTDYPDGEHDRIDAWFRAFAGRLTQGLHRIGMPLCRGHVMATNPLWRKSLSQWRAQMDYWLARRNPAILRNADIFFDFRAGWGEESFADALRVHISERLRGNARFLGAMVRLDEDYGVALGLFNRFVLARNEPHGRGRVDLKLGGILPLINAVRVLALRDGVTETSTLARIEGLRAAGTFDPDEADYLAGGFRDIAQIVLARQIADRLARRPVGYAVDPRSLTPRERDRLVDALKAIRRLHERVRIDFTGLVL